MKKYSFVFFMLFLVLFVNGQVADSSNYYFFKKVQSQLETGDRALNFSYINEEGEKVSLSSFKGKVVFIDFWASYCQYCVSQLPEVTKLQQNYPQIAVVRISVDEKEQAWRGASSRHNIKGINLWAGGMTYPADKYTLDLFYFDANEKNNTPASFELSNPIPGYVLIDQNGRIVQNWAPEPGSEELDLLLQQLLK